MQKNRNRLLVLACMIIAAAIAVTVFGFSGIGLKSDVSQVQANEYYGDGGRAQTLPAPSSTKNSNAVGDVINQVSNKVDIDSITGAVSDIAGNLNASNLGDIAGELGDLAGNLGGLLEGIIPTTERTTADLGYINPTPAASQYAPDIIVTIPIDSTTAVALAETFDYSATSNPYSKPKVDLKAGDRDQSVKWVQWIFIFTHYGLDDSGLTGIVDDATVEVIKKFQTERGLTVDGNITSELVDNLELFYYEYTFGANTTESQTASITKLDDGNKSDDGDNKAIKTGLIIAIAIIWVLAIIAIVLVVILAKKRMAKNNEADKKAEETKLPDSASSDENKSDENGDTKKSLEDLFN